jgi:2-methylcitrate dehydratase PrpD
MAATRTLARWIQRTDAVDLPEELLERTRTYLIDALAAAVAGLDAPWTRIATRQAHHRSGVAEATALGLGSQVPTTSAAWVNAMTIGACELDHGANQAHPASTVLPAALAIAEARDSSGQDTLAALVAGYEVACRVGAAGTRAIEDERGFHNPGTNGPFGAAASAARLLGLGEDQVASALGIAGSACGGLTEYLHDGSMTKRLHLAAAARGGLEAAELAADGFTGPATVLEGPDGFLHAFSPDPQPELLTEGLGEWFLCSDLTIKAYPAHGAVQSLVASLSSYRQSFPGVAETVEGVHLRLAPGDRLREGRFHVAVPQTLVEAQYSLQFTTGVALVRDLRDPTRFGEDTLTDVDVRRVAELVTWEEYDEPSSVIEVNSGGRTQVLELGVPRGHAANPMDAAEVVQKFHRHTEHALGQADRERLLELVDGFGELPRAGVVLQELNAALLRRS